MENRLFRIMIISSFPLILAAFIIIYAGLKLVPEDISIYRNDYRDFSEGWSYEYGGSRVAIPALPASLRQNKDKTITLQNTLPSEIDYDMVLSVKTSYQNLRIYVGGELVYQLGYHDNGSGRITYGFVWNLVPILPEYSGLPIEIEIDSRLWRDTADVSAIALGSEGAAIAHIIKQSIPVAPISIVLFVFSIFSFIITGLLHIKFPEVRLRNIVFLGLFLMLTSIWMFTDCTIPQLLFNRYLVLYYLSFFSFMLLPVPFLLFIRELCHRSGKVITILCALYFVNFVVCCGLYIFGIYELIETIFTTHILMLISLAAVMYLCVSEALIRKNAEMQQLAIGIGLLLIISLIALLQFYFIPDANRSQLFLYGLLIFCFFMSLSSSRKIFSLINASISVSTYKILAFTDSMTKLENRSAFSEVIDSIQRGRDYFASIAFLVFDLDNLKHTNDTRGHMAGDELIRTAAGLIKTSFQDIGRCFRIGGDEFAVVITDKTEDYIKERLTAFKASIDEHNIKNEDYSVSLSLGYDIKNTDELGGRSVYSIFNNADANMYKQKKSKVV